jgi:hypothetical protein
VLKKKQVIAASLSSTGEFVYLLTEKMIYCVSCAKGDIVSECEAGGNEVVGVAHHPFANILAVCDDGAQVNLFKP